MSRPAALALLLIASACVPAERATGDSDRSSRPKTIRSARPALEPIDVMGDEPEAAATTPAADDASPLLQAKFEDEFERADVGDDYFATGSDAASRDQYRLERGRLCVKGARNHPLWLRRRLPLNARIQVEAESQSDDGDIKLEAWGDGQSAATRISYTDATSYLAIFGGWKNRYHVLARLDEHAKDRPQVVIEPGSDDPRQQPAQAGRRYRLKVERSDGRTVRFWVDDVEMLSLTDPQPLHATGHDHFAFNDWEAPVCFDHLIVEPLPS